MDVPQATQGTIASFEPDTRAGSVLLDDGTSLDFDGDAFGRGGLRMARPGQRVRLRVVDGAVTVVTHVCFPLP